MQRIGTAIATLALCVQLAFVGAVPAPAISNNLDALGPHALCLSAADVPGGPADGTPAAPVHVHDGLCCQLHVAAGTSPPATAIAIPVAYDGVAHKPRIDTAFIRELRRDPRNTRAPPTLT